MKVRVRSIESVLHASQLTVYRNLARFNVLEIGRRWGKTTFGIQLAIEDILAGRPHGWFAPSYKYLADPMREIERALKPMARRIDRVEKRMEFLTGGFVDFWTLEDEEAGRGRSYSRVTIDEAGFAPKLLEAWRAAIYPTLTDRKGGALFLGTPKGTGDFHRLFTQAEQDTDGQWKAFRIASQDNPLLDPAEVEMARRMLPEPIFRQEFEGVPADDGGNPFGLKAIAACIREMSRAEPEVWGVDLAKSQDWTVAVALDRDGAVCRLERWQSAWSVTRERLAHMIGDRPAQIDSTGVGDPIVEDLRRTCRKAQGFKFTQQSKQQLMEGLQIAIQGGDIRYPDGWLRSELEAFGFRYSGRGAVSYEATVGHDDGVCALALAVMARRERKPLVMKVI